MPNKKASKKAKLIKQYKTRAKLLKKHKLIDYDLRHNLTPQQKAAITKLWAGKKDNDKEGHHGGWGHLIDNKNVTFRTVSNKRANQLKKLGYPVHGNRVYIDTEGYDDIHIKGDTIIKSNSEKEVRDYLVDKEHILPKLKKLKNKKLKKGESVTVRIGDNSPFRKTLDSFESLLNYVSNWTPKNDFNAKDDLLAQMSIVKFK